MDKRRFFLIWTLIFFYGCSDENSIRTYRIAKSKQIVQQEVSKDSSSRFVWIKPQDWIVSNGSNMRIASFDVPFENGDKGDLSVIELAGTGGGLESNVNRWRRQLNLQPLPLSKIQDDLIDYNGKMGSYSIIEITNKENDASFLSAIIPMNDKTIFVKLSGTPTGIKFSFNNFISFCSSINLND